jgi:chitodextrinase
MCFVCFALLCGCQQSFQGNYLQLEMIAPQQAVLYIVKNDTTVAYGGGITAVKGKTSWEGEMNTTQRLQYETLLEETRWTTQVPVSDTSFGSGHYKIRVRSKDVDNKFTLSLRDTKATTLYNFLQEVASSRLDKHLRSLPKPNVDVIIDRTKSE